MKRNLFILIFFYLIILLGNSVIFFQSSYNFFEQNSLMNLNVNVFKDFNIENFNIQLVIQFLLLCILAILYLFNDKRQYHSYLNMLLYRTGKKEVIFSIVKLNLKKCTVLFLFYLTSNFIFSFIVSRIEISEFLDTNLLQILVYYIRFTFILFFATTLYDFKSLYGETSNMLFYIILSIAILVVFDVLNTTNIITLGKDLVSELIAFILEVLLGVCVLMLFYYIYKRKDDLL